MFIEYVKIECEYQISRTLYRAVLFEDCNRNVVVDVAECHCLQLLVKTANRMWGAHENNTGRKTWKAIEKRI